MGIVSEEFNFPEKGILWRGWEPQTLDLIAEKGRPVLLFVADNDSIVAPFLRELLRAMPRNATLRGLLHEHYVALFIKADAIPEELAMFGAGGAYYVAILSPSGFNPLVTIDPVTGNPDETVEHIAAILEKFTDIWP